MISPFHLGAPYDFVGGSRHRRSVAHLIWISNALEYRVHEVLQPFIIHGGWAPGVVDKDAVLTDVVGVQTCDCQVERRRLDASLDRSLGG